MITKIVQAFSPIYGAPYGIIAPLVPTIKAPNFEGLWTPLSGAKAASIEVAGSMATLGLQLYGTNDPNVAAENGYTITIGGTITNADTIAATFANPNLPNGSEKVTIPVVTADTTSTLAAKLAAAINADTNLAALAITASAANAVVSINFPSSAPGAGATGGSLNNGNITQISTAVTGGATETAAVATLATGTAIGSAIAAFGLTELAVLPAFIKARLTTLTGANAFINANLSAAI